MLGGGPSSTSSTVSVEPVSVLSSGSGACSVVLVSSGVDSSGRVSRLSGARFAVAAGVRFRCRRWRSLGVPAVTGVGVGDLPAASGGDKGGADQQNERDA